MSELSIGLVNNMPDSALSWTEQQFTSLLQNAVDRPFRIVFYTLNSLERGIAGQLHLRSAGYGTAQDLMLNPPDALVVTGCEPLHSDLRQEAFWGELTGLLDWADRAGCPTLVSCLAAHVALLHFNGISRVPLDRKCFGVFSHSVVVGHSLTVGIPRHIVVPHSRLNGIAEADLLAAGYEVIVRSDEVGVHCAVTRRNAPFLLLQGHPEYESATLMKEYRRDIARFLQGVRQTYPAAPRNYFGQEARYRLARFAQRARGSRIPTSLDHFPELEIDAALRETWQTSNHILLRNWLSCSWYLP